MKKTLFAPMIFAFSLLLIMVLIPNKWIVRMIPANRVAQAATELNPFMFQGKYVQDQMLQSNKYLPIYGSSELARLDRFHPSNYFSVKKAGVTPFLIGRGGTESLIQFLNFSEHTKQLKGKKLVFILSPQWFQPNGADESHFEPNFSSLQGYDFAFNTQIDPVLKKKAIKRMLMYKAVQDDGMLATLYEAEISNDRWTQQKAAMLRPFAQFYRQLLVKKDLYYSLAGGTPRSRDISPHLRNKSWHQMQQLAMQMGKRESQSNHFLIINSQYQKVVKMLPELKNSRRGASYGRSLEYKDFQLVLDILKESGAKPLFISVPVNGKWYDYVGFPKKGRTAYYTKIKKQIETAGFPVADFSNHEYDPYFMKDTIHIGWKGWVYTDQAIIDFYFGNNTEVARSN
ncbi:MAG: D-alanyl-lipoteichoic acid biosynthesis protein DltD [Bacillota bacterium]|nr:D-alanyl-lipoteichoic acid biosynthesis protein DltD [Bacillota bacterium]